MGEDIVANDCVESVADSFKETIDDISKRIDQLDIDVARQQLRLLTMIGSAQKGIIADKDVKINELRDRMYDMDNDVASLSEKLEAAETNLEAYRQRNKTLYDTWRECDRELDRRSNALQASIRIMLAMAAFMLVELLVIAWLALA